MTLNLRKGDAAPTTAAADIAAKAASLVAAVPPAIDAHLDFFIVSEVVGKVGNLNLAAEDDFAKYALLLLQCGTVRLRRPPSLGFVGSAFLRLRFLLRLLGQPLIINYTIILYTVCAMLPPSESHDWCVMDVRALAVSSHCLFAAGSP
jgi:hypothetical protein